VQPTAPVKPSVTAMLASDKSIPGRAGELGEQVLSKDPARP
jgi:hypothetical protein